jgi:cellulose synthase/poly-beta-1,6-N-acetylglucosamine synthase-like glycosyltransferase
MAMLVLRKGYKIAYVPTARSFERASSSAEGEITRRKRIIAGRYQAIFRASEILPFDRPLLVWQIISHKFMRPLVPFFMIVAFLTNLITIFRTRTNKGIHAIWNLAPPFNYIFLALQLIFYSMALVGRDQEKQNKTGKIGKIIYLTTFLFNSNLAALRGFIDYVSGEQSHIWERVARD